MNDIVLFNPNEQMQLPAHLAGADLGVSTNLLATLGAGGNRIGLKGSRFRIVVNGKEEAVRDENYLDCIIVGVVPHISRMYYEGEYDQTGQTKAKPTCFAADGIAPPIDLPTRQNDKCETCRWNEKGSKIVNGQKMKACGYFQRLVLILPDDPQNRCFKLDVKAQGLFGDSHTANNKFNIRDYAKFISNRGVDAAALVTRLSFDTDSSVPKLLFSPYRYITAAEYEIVKNTVGSAEVEKMLEINMSTVDLSGETDADAAELEPVTQAAAVQATQTNAPQVTQAAKEEAKAQQQATVASQPAKKKYKPVPEKLGEFTVNDYLQQGWTAEELVEQGYIVEVAETPPPPPAKPAAPPAPPKPNAPPKPPKPGAPAVMQAVPMPGNGAAEQAAPQPARATAPQVQQVATDDELQSILADLT